MNKPKQHRCETALENLRLRLAAYQKPAVLVGFTPEQHAAKIALTQKEIEILEGKLGNITKKFGG